MVTSCQGLQITMEEEDRTLGVREYGKGFKKF